MFDTELHNSDPPVPGIIHHQNQATERSAGSPNGLENRRSRR